MNFPTNNINSYLNNSTNGNLNSTYLIILVIAFLVHYTWYYLTLPGSVLHHGKGEHKKPSKRTALVSYLLFVGPFWLLGAIAYHYNSTNNGGAGYSNNFTNLKFN